MPDYLTSLKLVRSDVFTFTIYGPCIAPTDYAQSPAGQVSHFSNTNTITHKLKSGYQPQNTGEHKIPYSLITVIPFLYPKHWKI